MKFSDRIELIKQYNAGIVTFLELCIQMQMDATQADAANLMKAAHADIAMSPNQLANVMDDMVAKQDAGLSAIPKLVY